MAWSRRFDEPIVLEDSRKISTLRQAIAYLAALSASEHLLLAVQAAAHCVTQGAENDGPMIFAPIGMMLAINRHKPVFYNTARKDTYSGKRKLKRD